MRGESNDNLLTPGPFQVTTMKVRTRRDATLRDAMRRTRGSNVRGDATCEVCTYQGLKDPCQKLPKAKRLMYELDKEGISSYCSYVHLRGDITPLMCKCCYLLRWGFKLQTVDSMSTMVTNSLSEMTTKIC